MSGKATMSDLTEQLIAATAAGAVEEIQRITKQITEKGKKRSFSDVWNYENDTPTPEPGSFESVWQFTKKGDSTR